MDHSFRLRDDAVLFEKKLKDVKSDVFKDLTIHYELERDQMRADNDSQIRVSVSVNEFVGNALFLHLESIVLFEFCLKSLLLGVGQ